jgi:hypothetical protein
MVVILHRFSTLTDLLGYCCSVVLGYAPCIKRGADPHQELSAYLTSPLEETDDVVAWWGVSQPSNSLFPAYILDQLHSLQYPTLARVARDYLPIQGSAVPSERTFSSAGITLTLCRNALAPSTFSALQLMKAAYKNGHVSAAVEAEGYAAGM